MSALNAGHETPKLNPISTSATAATAGVVANASSRLPATIEAQPARSTARAPSRSVSDPPGPVTISAAIAIRLINVPDRPRSKPRTSCR